MADGAIEIARQAAYAKPLAEIDVSDVGLFTSDTHWPWFERLRREAPVHYCASSPYGAYWSVTTFNDIIAVDGNNAAFSSSSELGGISVYDAFEPNASSSFIALDPPVHDQQRKVVTPMFSTTSMAAMEPLIRERAGRILDELPVGETFDFVDKVSIELTSQMLATLFDFPFELRRLLPRASDLILARPEPGEGPEAMVARQTELLSIFGHFQDLWLARRGQPPKDDLISMLANDPATGGDDPYKYFGNLILLTVAGSDTTRHSITGGLLALVDNPDAYDRLRANPALLDSAVPEIVRWQSPVAHMRRTATQDVELGGQTIRKGDKVVMWYVSGNRDDSVIADADRFIIDRDRPRQHVSFGFGVHRCVGNRLAEMQLKVVWEEMLKRVERFEVMGPPRRLKSNFVKGYEELPVRIAG